MKNTMPRLIDDKRRARNWLLGAGTAALAGAALAGWCAWMAPYRAIRGELKEMAREGRTFLERFDENLAGGDGDVVGEVLRQVEAMSDAAPDSVPPWADFGLDKELYVAEDRLRAERLLSEHAGAVAEYERNRKSLETNAAAAAAM